MCVCARKSEALTTVFVASQQMSLSRHTFFSYLNSNAVVAFVCAFFSVLVRMVYHMMINTSS